MAVLHDIEEDQFASRESIGTYPSYESKYTGIEKARQNLPETTTVSSTVSLSASSLYRERTSAQLTVRVSPARRGYGSAQASLICCTRSCRAFAGDAELLFRIGCVSRVNCVGTREADRIPVPALKISG